MARRRAAPTTSGALVAISKWRRRIRWIRRLVVLATLASSIAKMLKTFRPPSTPPRPAVARPELANRDVAPPAGSAPAAVSAPTVGTTTTVTVSRSVTETTSPPWVESDTTDVPEGYPVKVNVRSGIYHEPGGRSYDRTRADRWYRSASDAEADGFRPSKSA